MNLLSSKGFRQFGWLFGFWTGDAPDNSRLFVRDASTQEIYALDVDFP